jgi:predicted TPR repeat methyltransferase
VRAWREAASLAWWTDTSTALEAYRRITELAPDDASAWMQRGGWRNASPFSVRRR